MAQARPTTPRPQNPNAIEPLNILFIGDLEHRLCVPREKLLSVANNALSYYKPFPHAKPKRPFARERREAKVRQIDQPTGALVEIQQRIYYSLLRDLRMPEHICGGVKGRSVLTNVAHHQNASLIVSIDIKDYFPSITPGHVYFVWRRVLKCSRQVARLLTRLTTVNGHLPQGAPTSTTLSNMVMHSIDGDIRAAAEDSGVQYSSYVDDLPLSASNARELIPVVISTLKSAGFRISRSKLKVMGGDAQRVVNGVIAGTKPSISKQHRKRIRAALNRLRVDAIREEDRERYIASLKGRIMYLCSVNANQAQPFLLELSRILALRQS
jgi:hypothetical protein